MEQPCTCWNEQKVQEHMVETDCGLNKPILLWQMNRTFTEDDMP